MARASCPSCGLRSQHCQCRREVSTAGNANSDDGERPFKLTRASFCVIYLVTTLSIIVLAITQFLCMYIIHPPDQPSCYLEVFVDSVSVSNAATINASATTDWNVSFVTKSPDNGCKVSLHMIKSRLLLGDKLIYESFTPDYFGKLLDGRINEPLLNAVFKTVATPQGLDGGVVWDLRVNFVTSVNRNGLDSPDQLFLIVNCGGIPVNFMVDPVGNVKGSLLGQMRPCEYLVRDNYTDTTF